MKLPWEEIEELTKYLNEKGLTEVTVETKDGKITVKKDVLGEITTSVSPLFDKTVKKDKTSKVESKYHDVISPMVGAFYASPSPDADPFVQIGSKVKAGSVLCIIEAMKIMNELPSEVSGTVVEILVENGQTIEYGQVLMRIEPA